MKFGIFVLVLFYSLVACSYKKNNIEKAKVHASLEDYILAIHDSVMPYMDEIMKLQKQLIAKAANNNSDSAKYMVIAKDLHLADSAMMAWMHGYDPIKENMLEAEEKEYLLEQKEKILKVQKMTNESLARARKALNNNN